MLSLITLQKLDFHPSKRGVLFNQQILYQVQRLAAAIPELVDVSRSMKSTVSDTRRTYLIILLLQRHHKGGEQSGP